MNETKKRRGPFGPRLKIDKSLQVIGFRAASGTLWQVVRLTVAAVAHVVQRLGIGVVLDGYHAGIAKGELGNTRVPATETVVTHILRLMAGGARERDHRFGRRLRQT